MEMSRAPIVLFKPKDAKTSKPKDGSNAESSIVATQRKHFRELSIEKMNGATYSWQIRDPHLVSQILHCENKEKFTSEPFRIGELEFCLELYRKVYCLILSFCLCINLMDKSQMIMINHSITMIVTSLNCSANGFDEHSVGLTDLFLKLLAIPPEWNEVFVNYRMLNVALYIPIYKMQTLTVYDSLCVL